MGRIKTAAKVVWFSEYFGIDRPQYELPFVDFNIYSDVPLYIDPYAITKDPTNLGAVCHNSIMSYFQLLLEATNASDQSRIRQLIRGRLSEPSEIHLGVGKTARSGRGIGAEQEQQIIEALANSRAAKEGIIQAIQELELHIPGIGPDKISDLVANIILDSLAQFTEKSCTEYGIPTRPCAVSGFWNPELDEWDGGYFNLPVRKTHSYILVPRRFTRRDQDLMNHREFYNKYVLEVLQRDLLSANDSLVQTLKSGKRRVTKKSIREDPRFTLSKEFISQFIIDHPPAINGYRNELWKRFAPADPAFFSGKSDEEDPEIEAALNRLDELVPGREDANSYHHTVFSLVQFAFDWALENFEIEQEMDQGRGYIDIIADNFATGGLFSELRKELNTASVPIECKNYSADLGNTEFNQISDRLGPKSSRFGIVFCRRKEDKSAMLKHQTYRWLRQDNMILLFDDEELKSFVQKRFARNFKALEGQLRRMMREVKFGGKGKTPT